MSTLELFFDLVFVFVITQLAETLNERLGLPTLGDVVLVSAVVATAIIEDLPEGRRSGTTALGTFGRTPS